MRTRTRADVGACEPKPASAMVHELVLHGAVNARTVSRTRTLFIMFPCAAADAVAAASARYDLVMQSLRQYVYELTACDLFALLLP